jgi:nucleoside-diphosphate-sugar epimerase
MKKVVVTGGSGRLGQLVIQELLFHDYQVLSLDRVRPAVNACPSWIADLRGPGDLYQALTGAYGVMHLGAYQAPGLAPDAEIFSNNVTASYNVLKAAGDLGVKKVVMASSTAAFGFIYALRRVIPEYLPLDEKHPSTPQDPYGLSKLVGEQIADSLARLYADITISSLRFPGVSSISRTTRFANAGKIPARAPTHHGPTSTAATRRSLVAWRWRRSLPDMRL